MDSVGAAQNALTKVQHNQQKMQQFQQLRRASEARDLGLLKDNNAYVQNRSLVLIAVILAVTSLQVFFVRKLFEVKTGKSFSRI